MTSHPSNPSSPDYEDSLDWVTAYLTVHSMSKTSYRVTYALWIIIAAFFLIGTLVRLSGTHRPYYFAHWSKWALRRRTWRKHRGKKEAERTGKPHRQPVPLPSNSQLLSLGFLFILVMILSFVGPDYITPHTALSSGGNAGSPPHTNAQKRAINHEEVEQYVAHYTISKAWWTVAGRTGLMAFSLLPLCILLALKAAPFAIFALPYTIQFSFDKLSTLHRWVGRLIWFITAIHVISWSVQLATHSNPVTGKKGYAYAWIYPPFLWGWAAFALLTLLIVLSLRPFRYNFYESFYALHILLVPVMLITAAMHHPSVGWWAYSALIIWLAERAWRGTWWFYINGIFKRKMPNAPPREKSPDTLHSRRSSIINLNTPYTPLESRSEYHEDDDTPLIRKHSRVPTRVETLMSPPSTYIPPAGYALTELMPGKTIRLSVFTPECRTWAPGQHFLLSIPSINRFTSHPFTVGSVCDQQSSNSAGRMLIFFIRAKAGWTKTLWDTVVALSVRDKFHCDGEVPPEGTYPPYRGVLFRTFVEGPFGSVARTDWIEYSSVLLVAGGSGVSFGLSVLVYLCLCMSGRDSRRLGGSSKPFSRVSRVRFVWLAREFSHISWCASILKRCMALVPGSLKIDIFVTNIPKDPKPMPLSGTDPEKRKSGSRPGMEPKRHSWTPGKHPATLHPPLTLQPLSSMEDVSLGSGSPVPVYLAPPEDRSRRESQVSISDYYNTLLMPNPHPSSSDERYGEGGLKGKDSDYEMGVGGGHYQEDSTYDVLDYTHFNGDLDAETVPAEESLSRRLKQEGAARRRKTRKMTMEHQRQNSLWADLGQQVASPTLATSPSEHTKSSSLPSIQGEGSERGRDHSRSLSLEVDESTLSGKQARRVSVPSYLQQQELGQRDPSKSRDKRADRASIISISESIMDLSTVQSMMPKTGKGARGEEIELQFSEEELEDVLAMTEYAWPGRPSLDKLLQEEVETAKGAIVVACCGPTSLSASIRKIVAAQIDPSKIKVGDMRGYISCITEEFEY
ncbi:hypothetical protein BDM02DRAFT_3122293 [Thelephora ganbajun]|uniref:Uncharacterized protein n=1 Tax=Thelephora ganbajun TaxID=370292 RepID=A0ACB6Z498_THEGA|nr:hypothetical protein BDM02DRAFT_3122293 [Thelephora ganbajun]